MAHGAPDHRLVIDLVELVKLIQTINTIDEVTKVSLIDAISSVTNISSVDLIDLITNISNVNSIDLVDRITRIDLINKIDEITKVSEITDLRNIDSVDLVDRITRIDLINKIDEITKVSELTNLRNIDSVDLVDRITRIDSIDSLGEITIGRMLPLVSPPLLMFDQFDSGLLKWKFEGDGHLELSNERAFSGSGSMRLCTAPEPLLRLSAYRNIAVSPDLSMRLMTKFSMSPTGFSAIDPELWRYTGSEQITGGVRYDYTNKKWRYRTGLSDWVDIPGGAQDIELDPDTWHHLTLECDFSTKKFVQLKVDALAIDMSGLDLWVETDNRPEYCQVVFGLCSLPEQITEAYVDDCLVEAW